MARINMEIVADDLGDNFSRVLTAVFDDLVPGNTLESRVIMQTFRKRLERGFGHWESVSDRAVDTGY